MQITAEDLMKMLCNKIMARAYKSINLHEHIVGNMFTLIGEIIVCQ